MKKIFCNTKLFCTMSVLSVIFLTGILTSCNVSTANLADVKVCSSLTGSECGNDASTFPGDVSTLFCSANLKNAPSDTKVIFEWKHEGVSFGKVDVNSGSGIVHSSYKPPSQLEPGKYSVTVKIATDNATPITIEFTIE